MERNRGQEIKVGIFVAVFVALVVLGSFILGGGEDIFASRYVLHTSYEDVKGMKVGAVVRLAGMDVGEVSRVEFSKDVGVKEIEVDLTIRNEFKERIRGDSVASIQQIGVLGDMYVGITVGTADKPALEDDAQIKGVPAFDVLDYATTATDIVSSAANISRKVDYMLGSDDAAKQAEIAKSLGQIGLMLEDARNGKGLLHTLLYDQNTSAKVRSILANVDGITADVHGITTQVRTGDGVANALIYGKGGEKLTASITETAEAVNGLLADLKSQDSLAHAVFYDPERAKLVDELTAASVALRETAEAVNKGEGTAGLLVRDPQLYEDIRALVGGAQRNALLRAYIRATIAKEKDETSGPFEGPEGAN